MLSDRTICCAGNALRPYVVLSRLFDIPLTRTRAFPTSHCAAAAFSTTVCRRSDNGDPHARNIHATSLDVTLEAHRRANQDSLIRRVHGPQPPPSEHAPLIWLRPHLSPDRFDSLPGPGQDPTARPSEVGDPEQKSTAKKDKNAKDEGSFTSVSKIRAIRTPTLPDREVPPADYLGRYVEPLQKRDDVRDEDLPWFAASLRSGATPMERLRAEIEAFAKYIQPTPEEHAGRVAVADHTRKTWSRFVSRKTGNYKNLQLEVFGSERTGLATATSDIDLRVYNPDVQKESIAMKAPRYHRRKEFTYTLERAFSFYDRDQSFMLVFFRYARYPLISMQHAPTSIDVQLVSSNDTAHARAVAAKYMEELPALRSLYMVFRRMLEIRGLCEVYLGGMNSYSIFYMIAAGMKLGSPAAHDDPAAQLLAVLDFYSNFDATKNWISLEPPEILPKIEKKTTQSKEEKTKLAKHPIGLQDQKQPYLFCLRDPADETNDLGHKTFQWKHLQETLKTLNKKLREKLENDDGSLLITPLVGRSFELLEARRTRLARFGRKYMHTRHALEVPVDLTGKEAGTETAEDVPVDLTEKEAGTEAAKDVPVVLAETGSEAVEEAPVGGQGDADGEADGEAAKA
ncbi:pap 25a-associated [Diplodia corticola]|uniref:polynucleotide adenylyltransferase n=1 Tax=Diplodia corticola TaxID=236234 RepID=A0A1J9R937_9PEZI|nr:pap 25a-associated [Diplodia corticola]OJD37072.1 pap 25a-associated [Diplodia corticola]